MSKRPYSGNSIRRMEGLVKHFRKLAEKATDPATAAKHRSVADYYEQVLAGERTKDTPHA